MKLFDILKISLILAFIMFLFQSFSYILVKTPIFFRKNRKIIIAALIILISGGLFILTANITKALQDISTCGRDGDPCNGGQGTCRLVGYGSWSCVQNNVNGQAPSASQTLQQLQSQGSNPTPAQGGNPTPAQGGNPTPAQGGSYEIPNPFNAKTFDEVVMRIANWFLLVMSPIAVIMILYAGFLFMTSAGSEDRVRTAKKTLTWALVGIAIIVIGAGFITLIKDLLNKSSSSNSSNPSINNSNNSLAGCSNDANLGNVCTTATGSQGSCAYDSLGQRYFCDVPIASGGCSSDADLGNPCNTGAGSSGQCQYDSVANRYLCTSCSSDADLGNPCVTSSGASGRCQLLNGSYNCK